MNLHSAIVERNTAHGHLQRQIQYTIELLALRGFAMESRALHEAMHNYNDLTIKVQDCILRDARVLDERHIARLTPPVPDSSSKVPRMTMTRSSAVRQDKQRLLVSACPQDMKTRQASTSSTTSGRIAGRTSARLQARA